MAIINVAIGGNLQTALNSAVGGDTIVLDHLGTWTDNYTVPVHSGSSAVKIRGDGTITPVGTRIDPSYAAQMPKIGSSNATPCLTLADGADNWTFEGLDIIQGGHADYIAMQLGDHEDPVLANYPVNIIVDRCYVHGSSSTELMKRGISFHVANGTIKDCYIDDVVSSGSDSQGIWCLGPGPYDLRRNFVEAAGENILFGGADSAVTDLVPTNIYIGYNELKKKLSWFVSNAWSVKNSLELKNAKSWLIEWNTITYCWADSQNGYAIVFTPRNQDGTNTWAVVKDGIFQYNTITEVNCGINILGDDDEDVSQRTDNILIQNNLIVTNTDYENPSDPGSGGRVYQIGRGPTNLVIDHNTEIGDGSILITLHSPTYIPAFFTYTNALANYGTYGIKGDGLAEGTISLAAYFTAYDVSGTVFGGGSSSGNPPSNTWLSVPAFKAAFTDYNGGDYTLAPGSPYEGTGAVFLSSAPTNIDFASATDMGTSLPFTAVQSAYFSGTNYNLYFKRTCQAGEKVLGFSFTSSPYPAANLSTDYSPEASLYNYNGGAFTFVGTAARNCPTQVPAIVGETYYWKIESLPFAGANPAVLNIEVKKPTLTSRAAGMPMINSASILEDQIAAGYTGLPMGFIDPDSGIVDYIPMFICGEYGDSISSPSIRYLYGDGGGSLPPYTPGFNYSNLYDSSLNLVTRILTAETGSGHPQIRANIQQQRFYILSPRNGATPGTLDSFDGDGALIDHYSSLNIGGSAFAISADGLTAYIAGNGSSSFSEVKPLDLATLTFGTTLVARLTGYTVSDMLVLSDGTLLVAYWKSSAPKDSLVKRFSTAGVLLNTYSSGLTALSSGPRLGYASDATPHFWLLDHYNSNAIPGQSIVKKVKVSDGTLTKTRTVYNALSLDQQYSTLQSSTPIVSDTCPIVELLSTPIVATGTIIINKITVGGDDSFDFVAGGGLDPTSFSLANGESEQFSDVPVGSGYTISETPKTGWTTTYVVSNGSPLDNITVSDTEIVTITFTNTKLLRIRSGIYKVVPGKRNDTLWGEDFQSTEDVKIPNPRAKLGLIGE